MTTNAKEQENFQRLRLAQTCWNALEPGDPYNIEKSQIVSLPGKANIGKNSEVLCLFQAAEIQRLNKCLQEYRVKFMRLERIRMDRHMYEMQIKELTEMLKEKDGIEAKCKNLTDQLTKLTAENERLKDEQVSVDHVLEKIISYQKENDFLKNQLEQSKMQIVDLTEQALDSKKWKETTIPTPQIDICEDPARVSASYEKSVTNKIKDKSLPYFGKEEEKIYEGDNIFDLESQPKKLLSNTESEGNIKKGEITPIQEAKVERKYWVGSSEINEDRDGISTEVSRAMSKKGEDVEQMKRKIAFLEEELRRNLAEKKAAEDLQEQLKELKLNSFRVEESNEKEIENLREKLNKAISDNEKLKNENEDLNKDLQLRDIYVSEIEALRSNKQKEKTQITALGREIKELDSQLENKIQYYEEIINEMEESERKSQESFQNKIQQESQKHQQEIREMKKMNKEFENKYLQEKVKSNKLTSQMTSLKGSKEELEEQIENLIEEIQEMENQLEEQKNNQTQIKSLKEKIKILQNKGQIQGLQEKILILQNKLEKKSSNFYRLEQQNKALRRQNQELNQEIDSRNEMLDEENDAPENQYNSELLLEEYHEQAFHNQLRHEKEVNYYKQQLSELKKRLANLEKENSLLAKQRYSSPKKTKKDTKIHQSLLNKTFRNSKSGKENIFRTSNCPNIEEMIDRKVDESNTEEKLKKSYERKIKQLHHHNKQLKEANSEFEKIIKEMGKDAEEKYALLEKKIGKLEDVLCTKQAKCDQLIAQIEMMKKYAEENDENGEIQIELMDAQLLNYEKLKEENEKLRKIILQYNGGDQNSKETFKKERFHAICRILELEQNLRNILYKYRKEYHIVSTIPESVELVANEDIEEILNVLQEQLKMLVNLIDEKEKQKEDLQILLNKNIQLQTNLEGIKKQYTIQNELANIELLENEIMKLRSMILFKDHEVTVLEKIKVQLSCECEYHTGHISFLEQHVADLTKKISLYEQQIIDLGEENVELRRRFIGIYDLHSKLAENQKELYLMKTEVQNLQSLLDISASNSRDEKKRNEKLLEENELLRRKLSKKVQNIQEVSEDNFEEKLKEIEEKNYSTPELNSKVATLQLKVRQYEREFNELSINYNTMNSQIEDFRQQNEKLKKKYEKAKAQQHRSFKKLMLQYYRKIQECKSAKKSIESSEISIANIFDSVEKFQTAIAQYKGQLAADKAENQVLREKNEYLQVKIGELEKELKALRASEIDEREYIRELESLSQEVKKLKRSLDEREKAYNELKDEFERIQPE